jgi:hypothetical protein
MDKVDGLFMKYLCSKPTIKVCIIDLLGSDYTQRSDSKYIVTRGKVSYES